MSDCERAEIEAKMEKLRERVRITEDHIQDAEKDLELVLVQLAKVGGSESQGLFEADNH
jgi:phage shock protein A